MEDKIKTRSSSQQIEPETQSKPTENLKIIPCKSVKQSRQSHRQKVTFLTPEKSPVPSSNHISEPAKITTFVPSKQEMERLYPKRMRRISQLQDMSNSMIKDIFQAKKHLKKFKKKVPKIVEFQRKGELWSEKLTGIM